MKTETFRRDTKRERNARMFETLRGLGFTFEEVNQLRRIEHTLHRWAEQECGDGNDYCSWAIERDEQTGKPFRCVYPHSGRSYRTAIADRERGALRRLERIIDAQRSREGFAALSYYHQGDPRGCALYLLRPGDHIAGASVDFYYNRGVAVAFES